MSDPWAAALPVFDRTGGETVSYTGPGVANPTDTRVIWSDVPGEAFQGAGNTARTVTCEIRTSEIPQRPSKLTRIVRGGKTWKPIEIVDRDDVDGWVLTLEEI